MTKLATLCYIRHQGRTLMMHRIKKAGDIHFGKWNGLGGKLFPGETPDECVVREVKEESGLSLKSPRLHGFLTFPGFNGDDDWYVWVFTATQFTGRLSESPEGVLSWIPNKDLLKLPLWPGDKIFIPWLNTPHLFTGKFVYKNQVLLSHTMKSIGKTKMSSFFFPVFLTGACWGESILSIF